jgi:hypothetical protein
MAVFWVVASCRVVEVTDVSVVLATSIIRTIVVLMVEAARTSETSLNYY